MANSVRVLPGNVAMSSFGQSGTATTQIPGEMVGEKAKTVTLQGPYNAQQSSAATGDVVGTWADYSTYDYTISANLDVNSTNFKDPA
jgi:hypothetical protein